MIVKCPQCSTSNRVPAARFASVARCGQCKAQVSPPDFPIAIASEADFDELVRDAQVPVVVDFWAAWCGPCRAVAPEIVSLAQTNSPRIVVAKVDTEALPSIAQRFAIRSIPTIIAFRAGKEAKRISGAMPAARMASELGV